MAVDLFVVPTASFKLRYGIAILHLKRRALAWTYVTSLYYRGLDRQPSEPSVARETAPDYLLRGRDTSFGTVYKRRLDAMGIRDRPMAPRSRWQNGYVERVIGSIRRDCLDHTIIYCESHLQRTLRHYARYYDHAPDAPFLRQGSPIPRPVERAGYISRCEHPGRLHYEYRRIG